MNPAKEEPPVISLTEETKTDGLYQNGEKDLDEPGTVPAKYRGTAHDKRDMSILGKKQVLRVCVLLPECDQNPAVAVPWMNFGLIDVRSETSDSSPCWALRVQSWPAGRFYFREQPRSRRTMDALIDTDLCPGFSPSS